ncbi:MAG: UDP-N-acetylglucosamine 2-epimerase (non-hydrolyzing) [Parvularculaceae bacterium]|nr:UDP-N-acetylglucosamine 2-epimerase (non-hydrolyzing) [Parvularculaceae bacterium]
MKPVLTVVGARPQFIKAAPVSAALKCAGLHEILVHTGQHFDPEMSKVFFEELGLPDPAHNLNVHGLRHGAMTGRMLEGLERIIRDEKPGGVLIYGDTNSTLAGALAASKFSIPIFHVEAGLRSFNRAMPEEINRIVADHLSALLFCPMRAAAVNLSNEGIVNGVHITGDVMRDAVLAAVERGRRQSDALSRFALTPKAYALATVHRAENVDDPARFARIISWLAARAATLPVVVPVHPRARSRFETEPAAAPLMLIPPLAYFDMAWLASNAAEIYTDSGGLQKEAYFLRVPCVTLRDETEWVETVASGWNRLWTSDAYLLKQEIAEEGAANPAQEIAELIRGFLAP